LEDYFGMRFEDLLHRGWADLVHPDDLSETANAFTRAIQTGTSYQAVHRLRRAEGEYRWYQSVAEPLRDRQGNIIQWYGLTVDIDEAKKAEDRLRRSEAYLAEAQRLSHTGSAAYNETEILYWSEEASRIWGFDPLQGIPSREAVWHRIHPDDLDRVNENIERGVREKSSFANAFRIILPDGTIKTSKQLTILRSRKRRASGHCRHGHRRDGAQAGRRSISRGAAGARARQPRRDDGPVDGLDRS